MSIAGDGFEQDVVELEQGRIHYAEAGSGEPIVIVHGYGVNGSLWAATATRLAKSHRCIVPDLPFGSHREPMRPDADLSPSGAAEILAELLARLELDGVTIVANDSGGAVSQILVTERPQRVARLVLTNSDCLEVFPPGSFKLLVAALKVPGFMTVLANALRLEINQRSPLAYGALSRRRIPTEMLAGWVRPPIANRGVRRDNRKFGSGMDARYTLAAAERLPALEIPTLLAWGEGDRFFKIELAERLAALIPDSRLVRFTESLTFVPLDEPERLADEVEAFIVATPGAVTTSAA
jgi:pimeloyl-ACP methyl ester carboxylesterase